NTGGFNTAVGNQALFRNTGSASGAGSFNTAVGYRALVHNTVGFSNTAIGENALFNNTGADNTALGLGAGSDVTTANHVICIGAFVGGANTNNSCYIGEIWNQPGGSQAVYVNSDGKLGAMVSSRRFKDEIKPMDKASEAVLALKPVTFRYKAELDPERVLQFGLVAEDVEKVNSTLITRDADGKPYTVRYEAVNAMLLNEFLKEHRKVEGLQASFRQQQKDFQATVAQQQKQIEALSAGLQKVSAQVEAGKPAPQMVVNE